MALNSYQQYIWDQINSHEGPNAGNLQAFAPGNPFLYNAAWGDRPRETGPGTMASGAETAMHGAQPRKPPRNYDPNWFIPQGNAPATPSANAAVAAQSQVIRTPDEVQAKYEQKLEAANEAQQANAPLQKLWDAYKSGFGNLSSAIQGELGGRQALSPVLSQGFTPAPGSVGDYRPDVVKGNGQSYIAVPHGYTPQSGINTNGWTLGAGGTTRSPRLNIAYANDLASMVRQQMRAGGPVVADPVAPQSGSLPVASGLMQRPGVSSALNTWVDAYNQLQNVPKNYVGTPRGLASSGGGGQNTQKLTDSYNNYVNQWHSNTITENQAYLDQIGGGMFGGVVSSANNPQWYDTTPTWGPPSNFASQEKAQEAAGKSPWGQPGAPWQSQAWASGTYDPRSAPQFAGSDGQVQTPKPNWSGPQGMFGPQQGFDPGLVTNSPWAAPKQQNNAFGATSTPGMTFGASPWGSFW
jgi:hypothetical protein